MLPYVDGEDGAVYVQCVSDGQYLKIINEYVTLTTNESEAIAVNYFTIAFTASSPSTATTTTPCGAAMVALSEVIIVLATT